MACVLINGAFMYVSFSLKESKHVSVQNHFEFVTRVNFRIAQVLYLCCIKDGNPSFIFSPADIDLIFSNKITSDTEPLIRVGFILVMLDIS